jgi:hypothetical protein
MITTPWRKEKNAIQFPVEFDDADKRIVQHVVDKKLTMTSRERLFATLFACRNVMDAGIEGDFVECGVWRGGNALIAADVFARTGAPGNICLFDTFAGMTAPGEQDFAAADGSSPQERYEDSKRGNRSDWCFASLDDVKKNFRDAGVLTDKVRFIQGDVLETLSNDDNLPDKIAVLRLDTDWYESTKKELETLWPRLSKGGILMIDDYGHWGGARKAADEFFTAEGRPFFHYIDYTGRLAVKT